MPNRRIRKKWEARRQELQRAIGRLAAAAVLAQLVGRELAGVPDAVRGVGIALAPLMPALRRPGLQRVLFPARPVPR